MLSHAQSQQDKTNKEIDMKKLNEVESNANMAWYSILFSYVASVGLAMKGFLGMIPAIFYPENPAGKPLLFGIFKSTSFLGWVSPIALAFSWVNTFRSFKRLYQAENANFEHYADAVVSLLTSVAWTVVVAIALGVAAYAAVHILPWVVAGVFALNAVYGFFNVVKNLYLAATAEDKETRNQYLWNAAKQVVSVVANTLGFVVGLFLGIKTDQALEMLSQGAVNALAVIGTYYDKMRDVITAIGVVSVVGIAMDSVEMNKRTWNAMIHPIDALKSAWSDVKNNPLTLISKLVMAPIKLALLAVAPLQLFFYGMKKLVVKPELKTEAVIPDVPVVSRKGVVMSSLEKDLSELKLKTKLKLLLLDDEQKHAPSKKRDAKIKLLQGMLNRKESIDTIENRIKKEVSSRVYCSFFKKEGEVQTIVKKWREVEVREGLKK